MRRNDAIAATQTLYEVVLDHIAREATNEKTRINASKWAYRLSACGDEAWCYRCPKDGTTKTICKCCRVPLCSRNQRRLVQGWVHRIRTLAKTMKDANAQLPKGHPWKLPKGLHWRFVTVSQRQVGSIRERVNAAIKLRAALARTLREDYDMLAGLGVVEMGENDNVHVHFLACCNFVPNKPGNQPLKRWLQARDCTVPGCEHPADDRCHRCKSAGLGTCEHPEPEPGPIPNPAHDRQRCNGSWYVDVRQAYVLGANGEHVHGDAADAAAEIVKYAAKPVMRGDPRCLDGGDAGDGDPTPGPELTAEWAHAERVALFYLAMGGRHRVETYGVAKLRAAGEDDAIDEVDDAGEAEKPRKSLSPRCSRCGDPMYCYMVGYRIREGCGYRWEAPVTPVFPGAPF